MPDKLHGAYFTLSDNNQWLTPTDHCRGPWDASSCHAGPPTAMIARAIEHRLAHEHLPHRLVRLTANLSRPIPMAGFRIDASINRAGKSVVTLSANLMDAHDKVCVTATGLALIERNGVLPPSPILPVTALESARDDLFPITRANHSQPGFTDSVQTRYPPGETPTPGPTTVWMRSVPLIASEVPSGFQRICPLADSGNAFSRHAQPWEVSFVNADLTVSLHREPAGEWLGSQSHSHWQTDGIGLADALLFDKSGPVGRALQTLLLTPAN